MGWMPWLQPAPRLWCSPVDRCAMRKSSPPPTSTGLRWCLPAFATSDTKASTNLRIHASTDGIELFHPQIRGFVNSCNIPRHEKHSIRGIDGDRADWDARVV